MVKLSDADIKRVKALGFLKNTTNEGFSMRVITKNGVLNAEQFKNLSEVAEKYGNGKLSFTSRMTVEIPAIKYEDIEEVRAFISKVGLISGGTGAKVRPIVACKGTVCKFGNCDTQQIAEDIHDKFFEGYKDLALPHKFKIAVGGCPNNCVKPDLNDFGIHGVTLKEYDISKCKSCAKCICETSCPMKALTLVDGKVIIDQSLCNDCGVCTRVCYFDAMVAETKAFKVYIGGRWGKKTRVASKMQGTYTLEQVMEILDNVIHFYKENGNNHERLAVMLDRIGVENCFDAIAPKN